MRETHKTPFQQTTMKIPNNADKIANKINAMKIDGMSAVSDDGAVIINSNGSIESVKEFIRNNFGEVKRIGDGIQEGGWWINANDGSDDY